MMPLKCEESCH